MRILACAALAFGLISASAAEAQVFREPCHVEEICPGVESGGGRILNCLARHKEELSQHCLAAIGRSVLNQRGRGRHGPAMQGGGGGQNGGPGPDGPGGKGGGPGGPDGQDGPGANDGPEGPGGQDDSGGQEGPPGQGGGQGQPPK
jgi:hypothetical protein